MNAKILVCCHKPDVMATQPPYYPIHVGKELHPDVVIPGAQCDNEGINISAKNNSYCELTGLYWAWKNLKGVDIIGLSHYRRYFDFHRQVNCLLPEKQFKLSEFGGLNTDIPASVMDDVLKGKCIVTKPRSDKLTVEVGYCYSHHSTDLRKLRDLIFDEFPEYAEAFDVIMRSHTLIPYNMFIMKWDAFDKYCQWLFDVLARMEERIDISHYDATQARVFGYLAERLFNVYLLANKVPIKKYPILWIFEGEYPKYSPLKNLLRNLRNDVVGALMAPKHLKDRIKGDVL